MSTSLTPIEIVIGICIVAITVLFITYLAIFVLNHDVGKKKKEITISEITPETLKKAEKEAEKIRIPANALTSEQKEKLRETGAVTDSTGDFLLKAGMLYLLYETFFDNDDAKASEIMPNKEETHMSDIEFSNTNNTDANKQATDIPQSQEESIEQFNNSLDDIDTADDWNAGNEDSWDYDNDTWSSDW